MDLDGSFSIFGVRRFTEWPGPLHWIAFPVEILTKRLIHWIASPLFTENTFFTEKCFVASPSQKSAWWTFRIFFFFFFCLGRGTRESEAPGGGESVFYWKFQEGGVSRTGGAEGPGGCLQRIGGSWGGVNIFFRGRNVHQEYYCHQNKYRAQILFLRIISVIWSPPAYRKKNPTRSNSVILALGSFFVPEICSGWNGGSSASYLTLHPLRPLMLYFLKKGLETDRLVDFQGSADAVVRCNLRPVIFGFEIFILRPKKSL